MSHFSLSQWVVYISYYTINKETLRRKSPIKTIKKFAESKKECQNIIWDFHKPTREITGYTILDPIKGLDQYISSP